MAQQQRYYAANPLARTHYLDDEDLIDLAAMSISDVEPQPEPCVICMDDTDDGCPLPCGHYACASCIVTLFTRAKACEMNYPPSCCQRPAHIEDYANFFTDEFVEEYQDREDEYDMPYADRTYCAKPECAVFLPRQGKEEDAQCAHCGTITCHGCRAEKMVGAHHHCAVEARDEDMEAWLLTQVTMKACPSCSTMIELKDACNHMTCGLCRHEFCFICTDEWQGYCPNACKMYGHPEVDEKGWCLAGFQEDRQGKDMHVGFHKDTGLDLQGYDRAGFDADGINRNGQSWKEVMEGVASYEEARYLEALQQEPVQEPEPFLDPPQTDHYQVEGVQAIERAFQEQPRQTELMFFAVQPPFHPPPAYHYQVEGVQAIENAFGEQPPLTELIWFGVTPPPGYLQTRT